MIVADTSAIYAVLAAEDEAERMMLCLSVETDVVISMPNWLEAVKVVHSRLPRGLERLERLERLCDLVGLKRVDFDGQGEFAKEAFLRFGRGSGSPARLNYGDCFSYALARSLDAPLLYKGDDFGHTDVRSAPEGFA